MVKDPPKPLILVAEDVSRILGAIEPYQARTHTRANILVDSFGNALAQAGDPKIPQETLGALVAASVAATRNVGTILQPDEFLTLTHTGTNASVQLTHVAEGVLLLTVFDKETTVPVIVFYMKPLVSELASIVKSVRERKAPVDLGAGFKESATGALDDMFGEGAGEEAK